MKICVITDKETETSWKEYLDYTYDTIFVSTSESLGETKVDLILIDDYLQKEVTYRALPERHAKELPFVVAISEMHDDHRILEALTNGVDDYWSSLASVEELGARLEALGHWLGLRGKNVMKLADGRVEIDLLHRLVLVEGAEVALTNLEYELLLLLVNHPNRLYSREELLVLTNNERGSSRAIDTHIKNIRRKMTAGSPDLNYIETVHGRGYRYNEAAE